MQKFELCSCRTPSGCSSPPCIVDDNNPSVCLSRQRRRVQRRRRHELEGSTGSRQVFGRRRLHASRDAAGVLSLRLSCTRLPVQGTDELCCHCSLLRHHLRHLLFTLVLSFRHYHLIVNSSILKKIQLQPDIMKLICSRQSH